MLSLYECFPPLKNNFVASKELNLNFARKDKGNSKKKKKKPSSHFSLPCLDDFTMSFPTLSSSRLGLVALASLHDAVGLSGAEAAALPIFTWKQECLNNPETWKKTQA